LEKNYANTSITLPTVTKSGANDREMYDVALIFQYMMQHVASEYGFLSNLSCNAITSIIGFIDCWLPANQ
jgi:hypothetical protein